MKSLIFSALTLLALTNVVHAEAAERKTLSLLENAIFYDGYQPVLVEDGVDDERILRHSNSIYAIRLTDEMVESIGDELTLDVTIHAKCDNFDRVGNFSIALVPKGSESYKYGEVERFEIARLITPFMDKNVAPKEVPYSYELPDLALILNDPELKEKYDFWFEAEIFGIPYVAHSQIKFCRGHEDTFGVTASFTSLPFARKELAESHIFRPIYMKKSEDKGNVNLNNYHEFATDTIGTATRTFTFNLPEAVEQSRLVLISSNHGAGENGEEYVRRLHLVYLDSEVAHTFMPGGVSCEPYRQYNTMMNFIYQPYPQDDEYWSNSNWCPGQAIPTRVLDLGPLAAGEHKIMIRVPDAEFAGKDGDIRPSLYFQGLKKGAFASSLAETIAAEPLDVVWSMEGKTLHYTTSEELAEINLFTLDGTLLYGSHRTDGTLDMSCYAPGAYIVVVIARNGSTSFRKILL